MMKQYLLMVLLLLPLLKAQAQEDSIAVNQNARLKLLTGATEPVIDIYPVPVRENTINIKSGKEISSIKITNIIGQDIFRSDYSNSQNILKINLDNPQRGMYLVTIRFKDNTRIVKKILIEGVI